MLRQNLNEAKLYQSFVAEKALKEKQALYLNLKHVLNFWFTLFKNSAEREEFVIWIVSLCKP